MAWKVIAKLRGAKGDQGTWFQRLLVSNETMANISKDGLYRADNSTIAASIVDRPNGFTSPFELEHVTQSVTNNVVRQTARMKISGRSSHREMTRYVVGGTPTPWVPGNAPVLLELGTNLNSLTEPGIYESPDAPTSQSLLNRPSNFGSFQQVYVVYRAGTTIFQEGMTWNEGKVDTAKRVSTGGVLAAWETPGLGGNLDSNRLTLFGDSQVASSATSWDNVVTTLLDGTTISNRGFGGDNSQASFLRNGFIKPKFRIVGGTIPASGSVEVTTSMKLDLRDRTIGAGTLAGVGGTLSYAAGVVTFARTTSGTAVAASGWHQWNSTINTAALYMLLWIGGNDFNEVRLGQERSIADHIIGAYRYFVALCLKEGRTPIIAGVTNRLAAGAGTEGFAEVQLINRWLRRMFPDIFLDVQAYYSERAIYDAGLTPTQADLDAIAAGAIPPQLFEADGIHLIPAAHTAIGTYWIAPWLAQKGCATTTQTLAPLPVLTPVDIAA